MHHCRHESIVAIFFVDEKDIWRIAGVMIKRYGDDALVACAVRADELKADGDLAGARIWKRIGASIEFLTGGKANGWLQ